MKWLCTFLLLASPLSMLAATYTVAAGSSSSTIQAILNSAPSGSTIAFEPGTYDITSTLTIPCNNLTITGPPVFPNTAILDASFTTGNIFTLWGGCAGLTLEYLAGYHTGLLYVGPGNSSNINLLHNTTGSLPSSSSGNNPYGTSGSVYFDGTVNTSLENVNIEYNSFGDTNSCTAVFSLGQDFGGSCAGVLIHQGITTNIVIKYNKFFHLEEGLHVFETAGNFVVGQAASASDNLDVEYNYFLNIHRIEVEIQEGTINHPTIVSNNIFQDQSYAFYGSLGISTPCCQWSAVTGKPGFSPGLLENNNVNISSLTSPYHCSFCGNANDSGPAFAHEYWGNGSNANNNLIQGNFGNGIEWGYGSGSWEINNNQFCGPNMARNLGNEANFISNEESQNNPPSQVGNVTSSTCSAITSIAPTISQTSGNGIETVTLADPGLTSGPGPHGNTSIYYTTDGSNPVPGSGTTQLYIAPFPRTGGTVKAVGLYGSGGTNPQTWPTTYPAGYGYLASPVVTASINGTAAAGTTPPTQVSAPPSTPGSGATTVAGSTVAPTLVSASLSTPGSEATIAAGHTLQFSAIGKYSDGSVATLPDAYGNAVTAWTSTSPQVGSISSEGLVTAVASGATNIWAKVGNLTASPWGLTVTAAPVASQSAAPTLVSASLSTPGSEAAIAAGSTLQFSAIGKYSDGSVATLPDAYGNAVTDWTSTSPQVGSISSEGVVTAVGSGTTNIWAKIGSLTASPWGLTVTTAPYVSPAPTSPGAPIGDTFLGPFWKLVSPVGGTASVSNNHLFLNIPGGSNHDVLAPGNQSVRVMQTIGNYDFNVAVKIDSVLAAVNEGAKEGLMATSDNADYICFELAADGTNLHLSAETVVGGSTTVVLDTTNFTQSQGSIYLRLSKTGSAYIAYYSVDGSNWIQATSFTDTKIPVSIGLFGSNYNTSPAMAVPVAISVNWFHAE